MPTPSRPRSPWRRSTRGIALAAAALAVIAAMVVARGLIARGSPAGAQGDARATASLSRAAAQAIAHGQHAEAESMARAKASDPAAAAVLARLAARHGRHDEAVALLEAPAKAHPLSDAALELGLVLLQRGRKDDARRVLAPLLDDAGVLGSPVETLLRQARAARALGQSRTANDLFRTANAAAPDDPDVNTEWGELFVERHNPAEAARSFRIALKRDAEWAPAHLGLARALAGENPPAAVASATRALEIDGTLGAAHLFLAEAALDQGRDADARAAIARALTINPDDPAAHALAGAVAYVDDKAADFEAEVAKALAVNPLYGDVYRVAAARAAASYRFEEAVALARRAIALEPDNVRAQAELGMHLLRVGEEDAARTVLEAAFEADRFDIVTFNLLQLLDTLDRFESVTAPQALVRLHPQEAAVLQPYALPIIEQAIERFGARYQVKLPRPILVEIFPKHDDFAVRTLGLPGLLGALGACFGRVVTLDSPRAREPGSFNWQATLWHELAHVFTLALSKQRVPRWLTEGISVYEEGQVHPEWARDSEIEFARAYGADRTIALEDLNAAFTRPDTVNLAYFQASHVVALIVDQYGEEGLRGLLRAFGEGLDTDAAMRRVTGGSLAALQAAFDRRMEQRIAPLARALRVPEGLELAKGDLGALRALAARHPGSYPVQMRLGNALAAGGDVDQAFAAFERAVTLVPDVPGPDGPRGRMAAIAEQRGDLARAVAELNALVAFDHTHLEAARTLARLAGKTGDDDARALAFERIVTVDPFDAGAHTALGQMALARQDLPLALREFQAALAAGPIDVVSAHCDLGETQLRAGRRADAKQSALAALKVAPTYERAQELLLKSIEGK